MPRAKQIVSTSHVQHSPKLPFPGIHLCETSKRSHSDLPTNFVEQLTINTFCACPDVPQRSTSFCRFSAKSNHLFFSCHVTTGSLSSIDQHLSPDRCDRLQTGRFSTRQLCIPPPHNTLQTRRASGV
ncbi:unnamed protein product [Ectocarpus sp. 8 AP-2014]